MLSAECQEQTSKECSQQNLIDGRWSLLKQTRTRFAIYSIDKASQRVALQLKEQLQDPIANEQSFNEHLAHLIGYEKVATQYGDSSSITKGSFSHDGALLATVGSSGQGKIWDTKLSTSNTFCKEVTQLKSTSKICDVNFHPYVGSIPPSAPNIITSSSFGEVLLWTLSTELLQQKHFRIQAHTDRINRALFDKSGDYFFTASYDHNWALWSSQKLIKILLQKGHQSEIHTACLHPDQSLFFTGDLAGFGMLWDLRTGKGIYEVAQNNSLLCSGFHPNGFELAIAGKSNIISIFDLRRRRQLRKIPAHTKLISCLQYNKQGMFLASVGHDNQLKLWHGRNYTLLNNQPYLQTSKITSIDLHHNKLITTSIDRKWSMYLCKDNN